jgi:hypothetical protein
VPQPTNKKPATARSAAPAKKTTLRSAAARNQPVKSTPKTAKPAAPVPAAKSDKQEKKPKKAKVIRDSFTMPGGDYAKIAQLKKTCLAGGVSVKKSELLRAGLQTLAALAPANLLATIGSLENVKTGRPVKEFHEKDTKPRKHKKSA